MKGKKKEKKKRTKKNSQEITGSIIMLPSAQPRIPTGLHAEPVEPHYDYLLYMYDSVMTTFSLRYVFVQRSVSVIAAWCVA